MMQTLFTWWQARSQREQQMLAGLAAVAALMLLWFAFAGLGGLRDASRERHAARSAELQTARALASAINASADNPAPDDGSAVADRVAASAAAAGLEFTASTPAEDGGLGVAIAAVKPTFLFNWLAALEKDQGVRVNSLAVERNDDATISAKIGFAGTGAR